MTTLTYHICIHTLQSPLLSFDTDNTTVCYPFPEYAAAQSEKVSFTMGADRQCVTCHCSSMCYKSLGRDGPANIQINANPMEMCSLNIVNNHVYTIRKKFWWIQKEQTFCYVGVANHLLHLLTNCDSVSWLSLHMHYATSSLKCSSNFSSSIMLKGCSPRETVCDYSGAY